MKKVMGEEVKGLQKKIEAVVADEATSKSKKMVALFELGLDVKTIASTMGVRYNFVYNVVSNHANMNGIQVETQKKENNKKDRIIEMFLAGKTNKEISIDLKTNYNYVFNTIKQYKADHPELQQEKAQ